LNDLGANGSSLFKSNPNAPAKPFVSPAWKDGDVLTGKKAMTIELEDINFTTNLQLKSNRILDVKFMK
jgi:hypothetical protein